MRFTTITLSVLAGLTFIVARPTIQLVERNDLSPEQELILRNDGDVSVFYGQDITTEEILSRDSAIAVISGSNIVEACELLSPEMAQDLAMRYLGMDERDVELNPWAAGGAAEAAGVVVEGIAQIVTAIKGQIEKDKGRRGEFTSNFITDAMARSPHRNWVICHTKHHYKFDGNRGADWEHRHEEFNVAFGKTIGYEIYSFKSGTFTREGDGGYLNWAYGGNIKNKSGDGKEITFGPR